MRERSGTAAAMALVSFVACAGAPAARTSAGAVSAPPVGSSSAGARVDVASAPPVSTPDGGDARASTDASAAAPEPALDDAARCAELRRAATAAPTLLDLRTALAAEGGKLGTSIGESVETSKQLISFCVGVSPGVAAGACVTALGLEKPVVYRAPGQRKWTIANAASRPGERMRAPRHGPAAILPMLLQAPRGRLLSNEVGALGGSGMSLPIHDLAGSEDVVREVCFVDRSLGEGK